MMKPRQLLLLLVLLVSVTLGAGRKKITGISGATPPPSARTKSGSATIVGPSPKTRPNLIPVPTTTTTKRPRIPVTYFRPTTTTTTSRPFWVSPTTVTTTTTTTTEADGSLRGCKCRDGSSPCYCVNTDSCQNVDLLPRSGVVWREGECLRSELCCRLEVDNDDGGGQCGQQSRTKYFPTEGKPGQAKFGEAPWMALLLISEEHGGERQWTPLCGGSLISMSVVLTAAHCISGVNTAEMEVRVGEWDYQAAMEELPPQVSKVTAAAVHEHYRDSTLLNDVALVFLRRKFQRRVNVSPLCLPTAEVLVGKGCYATGWGRDKYGALGKITTTMHKAELEILPMNECNSKLNKTRLGKYFTLNPNFLCALGTKPHEDVCQGEGGGPLVCPLSRRDAGPVTYVQMGVVSWGIDCGLDNVPGVYVDLRKYSHWIKNQLEYAKTAMPTFYSQ